MTAQAGMLFGLEAFAGYRLLAGPGERLDPV